MSSGEAIIITEVELRPGASPNVVTSQGGDVIQTGNDVFGSGITVGISSLGNRPQYVLAGGSPRWKPNLDRDNVSTDRELSPWRSDRTPLHVQMKQLESRTQIEQGRTQAELRLLSDKVELLARALESKTRDLDISENVSTSYHSETLITDELLVSARESGTLADLFDRIADENIHAPLAVPFAQAALKDPEPTLRAAAGRALSSTSSLVAQEVLPAAIADEQNRFVAAVLRGALRAATA